MPCGDLSQCEFGYRRFCESCPEKENCDASEEDDWCIHREKLEKSNSQDGGGKTTRRSGMRHKPQSIFEAIDRLYVLELRVDELRAALEALKASIEDAVAKVIKDSQEISQI